MYCMQCKRGLVECICPDIDERLQSLAKDANANLMARQAIAARAQRKKDAEAQRIP